MLSSQRALVLLVCLVLVIAACGGGPPSNPQPPPGAQTAPVSVTIRDTPPVGVTILSFEITVSSAVLQPGNVQLVTSPIEVEIKQLEIETDLLSTINVPAGTYTSIAITFTNPEITIRNDAGLSLPGCATVGAICEFRPGGMATVTYSGQPFPLNVMANSPLNLLIDVNLATVISNALGVDFTQPGGVTVSVVPAVLGVFDEIEDVAGRVTALDAANNRFTLQVSPTVSLDVSVNAGTEFEDFDDIGCATANLACVAVNQLVEVDLELMAGGALVAEEVELLDNDNEEELEGVIVDASTLPASFTMVLLEEIIDVPGIDVGLPVQVNILPNPRFRIDDDDLDTTGLQFATTSDLIVGQRVEVEKQTALSGATPPAFDTDRIKLKDSRFTARVQSVSVANSSFVVDNLPGLFTANGVTAIEVRITAAETEFEDVSGLAALTAGDTVSLRGLLFRNVANTAMPILAAEKVRRR
ncbi:MAG: DUF5666 domain-containing protein [Candidatus Acidiferrales bacterium]